MKAKSIKFVEKNIVKNPSDFGLDKDFLNMTKGIYEKPLLNRQKQWNQRKFRNWLKHIWLIGFHRFGLDNPMEKGSFSHALLCSVVSYSFFYPVDCS